MNTTDTLPQVLQMLEEDIQPEVVWYGALRLAAKYCDLPTLPPDAPTFSWQHGWHPPEHNWHPELIVGETGLSRQYKTTQRFFVARKDQQDALKNFGYRHVYAVGMPICYVPEIKVARIPGTLLVMPQHSYDPANYGWDAQGYVDELLPLRKIFRRITVCVSAYCFKNQLWVSDFNKRGFEVIAGANFSDTRALERMAVLFSQFEFVTSHAFGSHLPYASLFGAKVSLFGTAPKLDRESYRNVMFYQNSPDLLDWVFGEGGENAHARATAHLRLHPADAVPQTDWARWQLGFDNKRPPADLLRLFGWKTTWVARTLNRLPVLRRAGLSLQRALHSLRRG